MTVKPFHNGYMASQKGSNVAFIGRDRLKVLLEAWRYYSALNLRRCSALPSNAGNGTPAPWEAGR
jgi:hypothetical protein